ncbi:Uncharacterised protein [Salmonella enterica subsp. enterica serovar Typhimurium str. DT104]|nr:Uncharacterised protein [Salmonella enterica subsp. enterica serovar Typhimurium str. DT104]
MRTEGAGAFVAKAQAGHLFHQTSDFRHHHVVHGRSADQHAFRTEDVGQYFIFIAAGDVKDFDRHVGVHFVDTLRDGIRHHASIVRHGIVENSDTIFLIICRPFQIQFHDLRWVVAPYHAV